MMSCLVNLEAGVEVTRVSNSSRNFLRKEPPDFSGSEDALYGSLGSAQTMLVRRTVTVWCNGAT